MRYLFVQPLGGLCNRMRVITGAAELARIINKEVVVIWTADKTLNAKFSDLFDSLPYKVIDVRLGSVKQRVIWHTLTKLLGYSILDDKWIKDKARGKELNTWIDSIKDKNIFINANLDILLNGDYGIFKPKSSLLLELNNVECNDNVIGIHIRRTDNVNAVKYSPTRLFLSKVQNDIVKDSELRFYLATDDPKEEEIFVNEFGDKMLIYEKHSLDRNNPLAIKDALIDLYNLSRCRKIYGSYYSSFSDTAALWTKIEKEELKILNVSSK